MTSKHAVDWQLPEMEECEPGYLLGTADIFGTPHHVCAMQVQEDGEDGQVLVHSTCENSERLMALDGLTGGDVYWTVKMPQRDGEWVVWVEPYGK